MPQGTSPEFGDNRGIFDSGAVLFNWAPCDCPAAYARSVWPLQTWALDHVYIPPRQYDVPPLPANAAVLMANPSFVPKPYTDQGLGGHGVPHGDGGPDAGYYLELDEERAVEQAAPEPYTGQTGQDVTVHTGGIPGPTRAQVKDAIQREFDEHPSDYPTVRPWIDGELGGGSPNPLDTAVVPEPLPNELWSDYEQRLQELGFSDINRTTTRWQDAVVTKPAQAVLDVTPSPGDRVSVDTQVDVVTNPDAEDMPTQQEITLANTLEQTNAGVDDTNKLDIARSCLELEQAASRDGASDCADLPIFISGQDVREAADHDLAALGAISDPDMSGQAVNPGWVQLNYRPAVENPSPTSWRDSVPPCTSVTPLGDNCDEYPFYASLQGGGLASPLPNLKYIDGAQNQWQGSRYSSFLAACSVANGEPFLAVPLPAGTPVNTMWACNQGA